METRITFAFPCNSISDFLKMLFGIRRDGNTPRETKSEFARLSLLLLFIILIMYACISFFWCVLLDQIVLPEMYFFTCFCSGSLNVSIELRGGHIRVELLCSPCVKHHKRGP